jgi:aminocarboxymuconate-semialdehyde decarboxylase
MRKIDVYNHFLPKEFLEHIAEIKPGLMVLGYFRKLTALWDIDTHLRVLDEFDDYQQVLSLSNPPIENLGSPEQTPAIARLANDSLAKLCLRYADRFPAFIASLPMNNPDAAVREAERAITQLGARGVQVFTNVLGKPLSAPEFRPLFHAMAQYDLPVWVHPMRLPDFSDYRTEDTSLDEIWFTFGWPYETTACMTRLIYSRLLDELPNLKIVTHHMGGMIPYFSEKIALGFSQIFEGAEDRNPAAKKAGLKKMPVEYFRMLYADTATNGSASAARCGHDFFGTSHCLFASDAPFDFTNGRNLIGRTIAAIEALDLSDAERQKIFEGNIRSLLRLN